MGRPRTSCLYYFLQLRQYPSDINCQLFFAAIRPDLKLLELSGGCKLLNNCASALKMLEWDWSKSITREYIISDEHGRGPLFRYNYGGELLFELNIGVLLSGYAYGRGQRSIHLHIPYRRVAPLKPLNHNYLLYHQGLTPIGVGSVIHRVRPFGKVHCSYGEVVGLNHPAEVTWQAGVVGERAAQQLWHLLSVNYQTL